MPGTDVLRNLAELRDPAAVAIFERLVSGEAEATLHRDTDRPRTFDLAHLNDIHERLFADVYPFAGQLRYVDTAKPGQSGEPFLHHRWIDTYTSAVTQQLRAEDNLAGLHDPGQWADRAAYYWASLIHAHPYREGTGRTVRIWVGDLADAAGHQLDWSKSSAERNIHVAVAAAHGDYEPMRALLTVVAGGTVGADREIAALDDLDQLLHGQAWARTGLVFGTDTQRATLHPQLEELHSRIAIVARHLTAHPERPAMIDLPATERWRGLAASIQPALTQVENWPQFADELDNAAAAGIDVARELPRLATRTPEQEMPQTNRGQTRNATSVSPAPRILPDPSLASPPRPHELATAGYHQPPPAHGPRR
jgi:cell filamentation protein